MLVVLITLVSLLNFIFVEAKQVQLLFSSQLQFLIFITIIWFFSLLIIVILLLPIFFSVSTVLILIFFVDFIKFELFLHQVFLVILFSTVAVFTTIIFIFAFVLTKLEVFLFIFVLIFVLISIFTFLFVVIFLFIFLVIVILWFVFASLLLFSISESTLPFSFFLQLIFELNLLLITQYLKLPIQYLFALFSFWYFEIILRIQNLQ